MLLFVTMFLGLVTVALPKMQFAKRKFMRTDRLCSLLYSLKMQTI